MWLRISSIAFQITVRHTQRWIFALNVYMNTFIYFFASYSTIERFAAMNEKPHKETHIYLLLGCSRSKKKTERKIEFISVFGILSKAQLLRNDCAERNNVSEYQSLHRISHKSVFEDEAQQMFFFFFFATQCGIWNTQKLKWYKIYVLHTKSN